MKKFSLFVALSFVVFLQSYSQNDKRILDFIIVIDDDITVGAIANLQIDLVSRENKDIINVNYYPGNLSLKEDDYDKLMSDSTKKIYLRFTHYEYVGQKQTVYNYEIEIKRAWLEDYFNILRIYNLDKEKYRVRFRPCGVGKNYAYELQSPTHSFKLIQGKY